MKLNEFTEAKAKREQDKQDFAFLETFEGVEYYVGPDDQVYTKNQIRYDLFVGFSKNGVVLTKPVDAMDVKIMEAVDALKVGNK